MSLPFLTLDKRKGLTKRVNQHGGFFELTHDEHGENHVACVSFDRRRCLIWGVHLASFRLNRTTKRHC
jgi:hypothetical protein